MDKLEHKSSPLQLDDLSKESRTAVIAHATYDNVDRLSDICRPGMFNKSWNEHKADVEILIDHDRSQKPGKVIDLFETKAQAFTKIKFGNYTLGNDTMEMLDMGVMGGASFGFKAIRANTMTVKGKKVRELKEVYHGESTLTNALPPVNPESRVVLLTKAMENIALEIKALSNNEQTLLKMLMDGHQTNLETAINFARGMDQNSDLYTWIMDYVSRQADATNGMRYQMRWNSKEMKALKDHADLLEAFGRNAKASDACIESILLEAKAINDIISRDDTADTSDGTPSASEGENENDVLARLKLLTLNFQLS